MLRALLGLAQNGTFNNPTFTGVAKGVPTILSKSGIPFIKPPSGTMGNNGAHVLGTALPRTVAQGYMWFDANQIAAGIAAGWYWFTGTDTTHVTVFNSTYVSGTPVAGTATAFSTTGAGAITASTSEVFGPTITVPANAMGKNGALVGDFSTSFTNSAGAKTPSVRFSGNAGTQFFADASQTTQQNAICHWRFGNSGATGAQLGDFYAIRANGLGNSGGVTASVDTTAATTLVHSLKTAVATDWIILENYIDVLYTDGA